MKKQIFILIFVLLFSIVSCASSVTRMPDPDSIVPTREVLIGNLEDSGYTVEILVAVDGSDLTLDRVLAKKDGKFMDIVYGLSDEDAAAVFTLYCSLYPDDYDYYILARNGNYVYCVSDQKTFKKAGFTTTDNVGEQYIHN